MQYEYLCPKCDKLTEITAKISETTPTIVCECGEEAPKYFGHERGSQSNPEIFWGNFFSLTLGQQQKPQQIWHIPSCEMGKKLPTKKDKP